MEHSLTEGLDTLKMMLAGEMGLSEQSRNLLGASLDGLELEAKRLTQREMALTALMGICCDLPTDPDVGRVLTGILQSATEVTQAERGFLAVHRANADPPYEIIFSHLRTPAVTPTMRDPSTLPSDTILRYVLRESAGIRTINARHDPRFLQSQSICGYRIHSVISAPLILHNELIGALYLDTRQTVREFSESDMRMLTALTGQAAAALGLARLISDLQEKNTALERALDDLRVTQAELLQAERLSTIGRVAANVVHDLRSPMHTIKGYSTLIMRKSMDEEGRQECSQAIIRSVDRMAAITQEILEFVRGEIVLKLQPIKLSQFVADLQMQLAPELEPHGITFENELAYTEEVLVDELRLGRAIINIATNARDVMPAGGTFRLASRRINGGLELRLSDTGPGVPAELRSRLFVPFSTYGKSHGIGLGLAIARKVAQEHGGTLELADDIESGATFLLRLPASCLPSDRSSEVSPTPMTESI